MLTQNQEACIVQEIGHGKLFDCGFKFTFRSVLSIITFCTVAICGLNGRTKQELRPTRFLPNN